MRFGRSILLVLVGCAGVGVGDAVVPAEPPRQNPTRDDRIRPFQSAAEVEVQMDPNIDEPRVRAVARVRGGDGYGERFDVTSLPGRSLDEPVVSGPEPPESDLLFNVERPTPIIVVDPAWSPGPRHEFLLLPPESDSGPRLYVP